MNEKNARRETEHLIRARWPSDDGGAFLPWTAGQHGQQTFLKLVRDDEALWLYAGVAGVVDADVQRDLMKLTSEGWSVQGEVSVGFDGSAEPEMEALFGPELCVLEIGAALLPLVDPFQRAPLLEKVRDIRREVAATTGVIVPGIQVRDDLQLDPSGYRLRVRGVEVAQGQIFLDRFLAVGSLEQLAGLNGWTTLEPTYRLPAKWIEPVEREKAEGLQCTLLGGLAVLLTHLRETLRQSAPTLLGLQETHQLLVRLRQTHPIVVEDFLASIGRVRALRHVLRALLAEGVSIRDLVTILEVLGDRLEGLSNVEACTEAVRLALRRDILLRAADAEGGVRALVVDDETERRLAEAPAPDPLAPDGFAKSVREALEEHAGVTVLVTAPEIRRQTWARLGDLASRLAVVSRDEIVEGVRFEVAGVVSWKPTVPPAPSEETREEPAGFWKSRKKK